MAALTSTTMQLAQPRLARPAARSTFLSSRQQTIRSRTAFIVRSAQEGDSFQKVEEPVRGDAPDAGPPVSERKTELDREIIQATAPEKAVLNSNVSIGEAFRFKGALPEVANGRLAMLAFVAALGYEAVVGKGVAQQLAQAPAGIIGIGILITVASLVPILKGVPRDSEKLGALPGFSASAEILNGRAAMLGFLALIATEFVKGGALLQ